jgi:hypothetical protein
LVYTFFRSPNRAELRYECPVRKPDAYLVMELEAAILQLKQGKRSDIDVVRMLEIFEILEASGHANLAALAAGIATQGARIP